MPFNIRIISLSAIFYAISLQTLFPNFPIMALVTLLPILFLVTNFKTYKIEFLFISIVLLLPFVIHFKIGEHLNILKDISVFGLLTVGVLQSRLFKHNAKTLSFTLILTGCIGFLAFGYFWLKHGIYYIYSGHEIELSGVSSFRVAQYLNEPSIIFTGMYLSLTALDSYHNPIKRILLMATGLTIAWTWFLVSLRLQFILFLVLIFLYLVLVIKPSRKKLLISFSFLIFMTGLIFLFSKTAQDHLLQFINKFTSIGSLQKTKELKSIISQVNGIDIIVGKGLGATYYNPIYKGERTLTHTIISFLYLKTGLLGITGFFVLIYHNLKSSFELHVFQGERLKIFLSCCIPIINALFFQPTYSYYSFFIVLGLFLSTFYKNEEEIL